ncbi:MAG TPA: FAD binding domain-containing protein [Desulfotignum sp.]|nr:FAD binding domain-containing protein [Desulfotignum sp.]
MRLPQFTYQSPCTLEEVLALLAEHRENARILAGGTDLLVRMKKRLVLPRVLVSLRHLDRLASIRETSGTLCIGAKTPIIDVIGSDRLQQQVPALVHACERIGAVSIQHFRGTLGGNILQDNRCIHYNQSQFHRSGRQPCHKDGGKICYAREEADRCNSTCQSDGACALMALDAQLTLSSTRGERRVALDAFYTTDGIKPFDMQPDELLTRIDIPVVPGAVSAYQRLSFRSAIDYPIVCAGVRLVPDPNDAARIGSARIVVGAMSRSPLFLAKVSQSLAGSGFDDNTAFDRAGKDAMNAAAAFAAHNAGATLEYRQAMVEKMVVRALAQAADQASTRKAR